MAESTVLKTTAKTTNAKNSPNAIELLKADHREVEEMFEKFEAAKSDSPKRKIANDVCKALTVHARIEDEIFYPSCRAGGVDEDLLSEADVEHASAKELIAQVESGKPSDEHWEAKVKVLSEQIEHHVKEEEGPKGMFAQARKAGLDLEALGTEMAARKAQLMA